ncbi:MAG TPA: hypothetical protein VGC49_12640 [Solirubrobacterales bacterium]|jgi:hypothetical protein
MTEFGAYLLPVVPLLFLLVALLLGRYPGCEAIVRLAERIAARAGSRSTARRVFSPPRPPRSFAPGGGLLLALCLSGRAPPA